MERQRCRTVFEQYRWAVELLRQRVSARAAAGLSQDRWQCGVAAEIGLALHMSPSTAARFLARAVELEKCLPHTRSRLRDGDLSPEAVPVIVSGLSHLDPSDRREADEQLCDDPGTLAGMGPKQLAAHVEQVAYRLDARATVDRTACAEKDRTVTIRPLPEGMARVSILLPVAQGVGVYAALRKHAATVIGVGQDLRTLGQIMADAAFARLTGREAADGQPVTVNLTMPAAVLLGDRPGTAHLHEGGAMPAEIARNLVGKAAATGVAWVKRLYVTPDSGSLVAMDSRRRCFPDGLAEVIRVRDRYCRTPYCDAPIAHIDHITAHAAGGPTALQNGQGLCAACNYAKEPTGWHSGVVEDPSGRHTVETRTPSGHVHRSTAPRQAA
ncbi:HNH nuclease OS=Tsukamurella paurometabola (strain ATCC 8368 / DSM / CCUG 35730 / CIP 100753/ JCM 10117 / KCTC 9821 / NBRC 16120 / NCIMB 702349 / NCTC 13040) OX=521096 GN=Tpau_1759 PE=3 SV=1 [Tsukamurella paurometabola]|nr:HNH endonuclease signature motif containing protein [Tsukamurella paurometabola]SUP31410.1 HNH endonuclease [Tsukamurella paurometabola]